MLRTCPQDWQVIVRSEFRFGHSVYFVFASAGFRLPISLTFDPELKLANLIDIYPQAARETICPDRLFGLSITNSALVKHLIY